MTIINLRDFYYWYTQDEYMEVSDDVAEALERKERFCRLWNALNSLPPAQGRRVDACVILGKSFSEVALAEGVDESAVRRAVERGLENMKKFLKNSR